MNVISLKNKVSARTLGYGDLLSDWITNGGGNHLSRFLYILKEQNYRPCYAAVGGTEVGHVRDISMLLFLPFFSHNILKPKNTEHTVSPAWHL